MTKENAALETPTADTKPCECGCGRMVMVHNHDEKWLQVEAPGHADPCPACANIRDTVERMIVEMKSGNCDTADGLNVAFHFLCFMLIMAVKPEAMATVIPEVGQLLMQRTAGLAAMDSGAIAGILGSAGLTPDDLLTAMRSGQSPMDLVRELKERRRSSRKEPIGFMAPSNGKVH